MEWVLVHSLLSIHVEEVRSVFSELVLFPSMEIKATAGITALSWLKECPLFEMFTTVEPLYKDTLRVLSTLVGPLATQPSFTTTLAI